MIHCLPRHVCSAIHPSAASVKKAAVNVIIYNSFSYVPMTAAICSDISVSMNKALRHSPLPPVHTHDDSLTSSLFKK